MKRGQRVLGLGLILLAVAALTVANWAYARAHPGGTDFLVHWVAARHVLFEGRSPYTDPVAHEIQMRIYGRPARPDEHQQRVVYPLYSVLVFAPFAWVQDFTLARALWMTLLEVCLVATLGLGLALARWRPAPLTLAGLLLFTLTWYHGLRTLINGNAVGVVAFLLALAAWAGHQKRDGLAGAALALSAIKPNLALLPIVFTLGWAWRRGRRRLLASLLGTWAFLAGLATLWHPRWWFEYARELRRFPGYNPPGTLQAVLRAAWPTGGAWIGALVSLGLLVLLAWAWTQAVRRAETFPWAFWLTLAASQWIGIQTDPGNFVVLLPALVYVWAEALRRWGRAGEIFVGLSLLGLWLGVWAFFVATVSGEGGFPTPSPWLFLPVPGYALLGLLALRPLTSGSARAQSDTTPRPTGS